MHERRGGLKVQGPWPSAFVKWLSLGTQNKRPSTDVEGRLFNLTVYAECYTTRVKTILVSSLSSTPANVSELPDTV